MIEGGCLCGAVRYSVDQPALGEAVCHCRNCQRQSGSAFSVLVAVRLSAFKLTGTPALYEDRADSGAQVNRYFCGACGSPIYTALPASPKLAFIKGGTLDNPSLLAPKTHVWCNSKWPWTAIAEGAVTIAKNPP